jgi:hypothetical protein
MNLVTVSGNMSSRDTVNSQLLPKVLALLRDSRICLILNEKKKVALIVIAKNYPCKSSVANFHQVLPF